MDFGMLFCRVCFHYGIGFRELLALPLKTFWMLNKNITRLLAEKDLRALNVAICSQGGEIVGTTQARLIVEFDNPYQSEEENPLEAERDEAGFAQLKMM